MVDFTEDIEANIAVFLKGEASPEIAMHVVDWMEANPENKERFLELEKVYALTHGSKSYSLSDTDESWKAIQKAAGLNESRVIQLKVKREWLAIAAIFVVALIAVVLWKTSFIPAELTSGIKKIDRSGNIENRVLVATAGVESFNLSDQSEVKLEDGSRLILDKNFNGKERKLELFGSGEFHVIHDEEKPFILKVNNLDIIDIGTVFKVKTIGDTVKISVSEGAVELRLNDQLLSMQEGDSAFYLIQKEVISRYKTPKQRKDKVFAFDGTKLKDAASLLSEFFNQPIAIKNKEIEDCPLTVTFRNENLITILDIIKELMDVKMVQKNNTIEIYGKGCN